MPAGRLQVKLVFRLRAKDNKPVLKLVPLNKPKQPRKPGSGTGQILYVAPHFDATPEGFDDYV